MKLIKKSLFTLCLSLLSASSANAALLPALNYQAVYDTDLNITWLADGNLVTSNNFGVTGPGLFSGGDMNWSTAQTWIGAMNVANYLGYNDWRLPTTLQPDATCGLHQSAVDFGPNCTGSEMGHLFYNELGGVYANSLTRTHNANYILFRNLPAFKSYWSSTAEVGGTGVYTFDLGNSGWQGVADTFSFNFAMAVRSGQVAIVPLPAAAWLFGSGLIFGFVGFARKRKLAV